MKFYVLTGHYTDVYFGDKSKGEWQKIGVLRFIFCLLRDKEVRLVGNKKCELLFSYLRTDIGAVFIAASGAIGFYLILATAFIFITKG